MKYADDLLKAYPPYVNFYEDSKQMLLKCEKANPRFYAFLRVCQSKPESGRQHLADLLMHPIQRLPRVILLLTDILKQTQKEKPDHKDIRQLEMALNKIKEVRLLPFLDLIHRVSSNNIRNPKLCYFIRGITLPSLLGADIIRGELMSS